MQKSNFSLTLVTRSKRMRIIDLDGKWLHTKRQWRLTLKMQLLPLSYTILCVKSTYWCYLSHIENSYLKAYIHTHTNAVNVTWLSPLKKVLRVQWEVHSLEKFSENPVRGDGIEQRCLWTWTARLGTIWRHALPCGCLYERTVTQTTYWYSLPHTRAHTHTTYWYPRTVVFLSFI